MPPKTTFAGLKRTASSSASVNTTKTIMLAWKYYKCRKCIHDFREETSGPCSPKPFHVPLCARLALLTP